MPAPICIRFARNTWTLAHVRFVITVLVFAAALSSVALAQPAVTVSPKTGPPTGKVTVNGTGFGASEDVDIYFDTTDLALAATDPSGSFTGIPLTIPASATPGKHRITGVGRQSALRAQTSFIVQTKWSQFRFGPQHQGHNPTENILNVSNVGGMQLLWTAATGNPIANSAPAVANGVVYVGSLDNNLYAFNAATGQPVWSAATNEAIESSPAVANGLVYVGSFDNKLHAFNAATGQPVWTATTRGGIFSSPAVANGVVYVGSFDGKLYAFNAATGHPIWSAATGSDIFSSPAVANGVVYVGSWDYKLYAFDAATGQPIWSAVTGNQIYSSPAVANGVVYVGSTDNNLYAFGLPPASAAALTAEPFARPDPATLKPDLALVPQQ